MFIITYTARLVFIDTILCLNMHYTFAERSA